MSAEYLSERKAIVNAAITVTPLSCPSTPLAPMLTMFMRNTIQTSAKMSEMIQMECATPKREKVIWGVLKFIIPPRGLVMNEIPIPDITTAPAAKNPKKSLKYGFKL